MPRLTPPHRDAVCPRLTINDLFYFRDVFHGLRAGLPMNKIARELGISKKKCGLLLEAVEGAIDLEGEPSGYLRRQAKHGDVDVTPAGIFHTGVREVIDKLASTLDDCQTGRKRVIVQGSEFSTLWLLPRVLAKSRFLKTHPDFELSIRRGFWQRFIANLERDQIDLAIGPGAPHRPWIEQKHLLTVPRALIFHKDHVFAGGKHIDRLEFRDLSRETIFVLSGEPIPGLHMRQYLPKPSQGGRHILIDSISHMYQYVQHDIGVALGYAHRYGPAHEKSLVLAKSFPEIEKLPQASFYVYTPNPKHRKMSPNAEALVETILQVAPTLL